MASPTLTQIDYGFVAIGDYQVDDNTVLNVGSAMTVKSGTILARDSSNGKMVIYVVGGSTNGNGIPKAVLLDQVVATGSGDLPVRPLIAGAVNFHRLVVHADGTNANITKAIEDSLRAYGIVPRKVDQAGV